MKHVLSDISVLLSKVRVWGVNGIVSFFRRKITNAIFRKRLVQCVRKSRFTTPERGVTVVGELTAQVSLSKTLRDFVLNLQDARIPCQTYDTCLKPQIPVADMARIITSSDDFDIGRYSHIVMMYRCPLSDDLLPQCKRLQIAFHDSEHGVHVTAPYLGRHGAGIIAMSDFNYRYFQRTFKDNDVFKVTYPFRFRIRGATPRGEMREKYGIDRDDFVVFFNFDFGSYYRKNIPAALKAFSLAFKDDRKAWLVFKTKGARANPKQVREMEAFVQQLGIADRFIHVSSYLPRTDVDGLTEMCDVYLSLHKSEGFGIGMAEAMSQGKPVVATDWSANTEFCRPDTAWCVPYRIVPILPHEYPVEMKEWAEADVAAAAAALREIRANPTEAAMRAARGKAFMEEHFSVVRFKKDMENLLERNAIHNDDAMLF